MNLDDYQVLVVLVLLEVDEEKQNKKTKTFFDVTLDGDVPVALAIVNLDALQADIVCKALTDDEVNS